MKHEKMQVLESNTPIVSSEKNHSGFIKTFGKIFFEYGNQGKQIVQQKMLELFPEKAETIEKWTTWYKAYYNMGKISGYETPEKISWKKANG